MNPVFDLAGIRLDRQTGTLSGLTFEEAAALREALAAGRVILLRGFIEKTWADELRATAHDLLSKAVLLQSSPVSRESSAPVPNHPRVESFPQAQGLTATVRRSWLALPWNASPRGELSVALGLAELRHAIDGSALSSGSTVVSAAAEVMQYPRGGGFQARHGAAIAPGAAVVAVALSQRGRDFTEGGLHVETAAGRVDVDGHLALGDAYLFQSSLLREVTPIDPGKARAGEIDWHHPGGRWTLRPSRRFDPEAARISFEDSLSPGLAPPSGASAGTDDLHAEDVTAEWCALLGIRHAGQRVGPAVVESVGAGEVRFRWAGAAASLAVSCRPARRGPAFCSSALFAIHYRLEGGQSLTALQARFLYALCAATRAAEARQKRDPALRDPPLAARSRRDS
jgi:hypothetical protein